jgi:hypothetical protein
MPLASTFVISTGSLLPVELRASLRAAIILERSFGFPSLIRGISEGNFTILSAIVQACACTPHDAAAILAVRPIGKLIRELQGQCQDIVLALAGHDLQGDKAAPATAAAPIPFSEFYASLYRIAAGNLGWPPEQALSATPLEIVEAAKGRAELLQAIFGAPEKPSEPIDPATINHPEGIARLREIFGGNKI